MGRTLSENIIESSLWIIIMTEVSHLAGLFFELPFSFCAWMLAGMLIITGFAVCGLGAWRRRQKQSVKVKRHLYSLFRLCPYRLICIGVLILMQFLWNDLMHVPDLQGDITVETVQTFLVSDGIYTVNPLTGTAFLVGMPLRIRILSLPTLYAAVCKWTGISPMTLCYSIVPCLVLLLSYLVYTRWAVYLFPGEEKKQVNFMLFVALLYQFGCYNALMDSSSVFFHGWQGETLRVAVLLPYALLCALQGKWKQVFLCLLTEVCVVWTLYGLGYVVIIAAAVLAIRGICSLKKRRAEV